MQYISNLTLSYRFTIVVHTVELQEPNDLLTLMLQEAVLRHSLTSRWQALTLVEPQLCAQYHAVHNQCAQDEMETHS